MNSIEVLLQKIDQDIQLGSLSENEKQILKKNFNLPRNSIAIAQAAPWCSNVEYNFEKAKKYINWANFIELDAIIFPELFLCGYPVGDYLEKFQNIVEKNLNCLEKLASMTKNTKVIIGFVDYNKSKFGKSYFNSVAVLGEGKILKKIKKSLIPNYCEFDDCRYFESGTRFTQTQDNTIEIGNKKASIVICEDGWNDEDFFDKNLYEFDPIKKIIEIDKPDIIINCSASISRTKKEQLKHNMLSFVARKYGTKLVYVNQTGSSGVLSFDGASKVYDDNGKLIARAKSFEEQFFVFNIDDTSINIIEKLPLGLEKSVHSQKEFTLEYEFDLHRTYLTIIQSIRDYFKKNGFERAVLGLSGGLDSAICAVLLVDALGCNNVLALSMPSEITTDLSKIDAKVLAKNLDLKFVEYEMKNFISFAKSDISNLFIKVENEGFAKPYFQSYTQDNIQARLRALMIWSVANEFEKTLPIATSDKSELYMGYATINGDMSGGFAPIADVTKTKLFALGRFLNKYRKDKNVIPESILTKPPGAELAINPKTNKPLLAQEALMPYEFLDEVIWRIENLRQSKQEMLKEKFFIENKMNLTKEQKKKWLDKFFLRLSKALYKWSILPPSPIVDCHSINKVDYRHPIVANRIDF